MSTDDRSKKPKGLKRINFFKGFLTTERDWNDAEAYHIEKRKLHNRILHAPGVVLGVRSDLRVVARSRGNLAVEILPGYAIDGDGHDLVLHDSVILNINPEDYRLPQTIYVVVRFFEELTDFIAYKENLEYKGHRRVLEAAKVELSQTEPEIGREVELARIYLEKGAQRIRDARDPADPRANEIDMRFVPRAGSAGARLSPVLRMRMEAVLWQLRSVFLEYSRRGIITGHDVLQNTSTALMLTATNLVDLTNVFDIWYLLVESQHELTLECEVDRPAIQEKKEFGDFKRHVEILRGLLAEGKNNEEAFTNLLAYQTKCAEVALQAVADEEVKVREEPEEPVKIAELTDWESVKGLPRPREEMELEGLRWVLVDEIDVLDKDSEEKHEFAIKEAKDSYRTRQKLKYPDGTVVEDVGRAQVHGFAEFKVFNLVPNRPTVILRRMDYVYGDYEIEYIVNGKSATTVSCPGIDRVHRWRNWPALIPAELVTDETLSIKQVCGTAGRDVNMFHIWVYQTIDE